MADKMRAHIRQEHMFLLRKRSVHCVLSRVWLQRSLGRKDQEKTKQRKKRRGVESTEEDEAAQKIGGMVVCPKIKDHQVEGYNRQRVDDVLFSKSQRKVQAIVNTGKATKGKVQDIGEVNKVMPLPLPSSDRVRG